MWEGACPRWRSVSQYMHGFTTAIGGKPPPTFLTEFGFQYQVGYKAALLWLLIWGAPLTTLAEPRRGTEWWGKDLLVTLGLFQSDPL